jgi:hypothetical protein
VHCLLKVLSSRLFRRIFNEKHCAWCILDIIFIRTLLQSISCRPVCDFFDLHEIHDSRDLHCTIMRMMIDSINGYDARNQSPSNKLLICRHQPLGYQIPLKSRSVRPNIRHVKIQRRMESLQQWRSVRSFKRSLLDVRFIHHDPLFAQMST